MTSREKVIGFLQETAEFFRECRSDYSLGSITEIRFWEFQNAANEAVKLLKEQEPVIPKTKVRHEEYPEIVHRCGKCKAVIDRRDKYCRHCGRKVKWDA